MYLGRLGADECPGADPQARTALEFGNPLEILIATILAAQCTDERVNKITPGLFLKYPTAAAFARSPSKFTNTSSSTSGSGAPRRA